MVRLPKRFTATRLPGYFWDTKNKKLFSIKCRGELRELVKQEPNYFNRYTDGYRVSHKGYYRWLKMDYLNSLEREDSVINVKTRREIKNEN